MHKYCNRWKLCLNKAKTKVIVFRKGGRLPQNLNFYYDGYPLEIVNKFSYLGIVFTTGGSFSETHKTLSGQAQKAIFRLRKYLYKYTNISIEHTLELFDKLVKPILLYGSEVWGFTKALQIERIHTLFCKSILYVKTSTQNDFIYGELGRTDLYSQRIFRIIKYWLKVTSSIERKYIKLIYLQMLSDIDKKPRVINWASQVRDVLGNLGFFEVWLAQGVGNQTLFLSKLKQRISDVFIQEWTSRINLSSRARFYRVFAKFEYSFYLKNVNISKYLTALTRLRLSAHHLSVETGRWRNISLSDRLCSACQKLEDEFHLLFECKLYNSIRKRYINQYYVINPNMYKTAELFNSHSVQIVRNLAMFVYKAFEIRKESTLQS